MTFEALETLAGSLLQLALGGWILREVIKLSSNVARLGAGAKDNAQEIEKLRQKAHDINNELQVFELRIWKLENQNEKKQSNSGSE